MVPCQIKPTFRFRTCQRILAPQKSLMKGEGFFSLPKTTVVLGMVYSVKMLMFTMCLFLQQWFMACITFTALTGWPLSCFHNNQLLWVLLSSCLFHCLCNRKHQSTCKRHLFTAPLQQQYKKIGVSNLVFPADLESPLSPRIWTSEWHPLHACYQEGEESSNPRSREGTKMLGRRCYKKLLVQLKKELDINFLQHEGFIMRS